MTIFQKDEKKTTDTQRFLEFYLGKESYAVDLLKVKEVITPPEMTPIPKCPPYVCGLMNLRGLVLTVIDLRKKLSIAPDKDCVENAVIIFDLGDRMVGAMVDSIQKVLTIPSDHIKPVPDSDGTTNTNFLGILQHDNRLTMWLDPERVMEAHSASAHSHAKAA